MLKIKALAVLAIAFVALVIAANATAFASNVNPWFGFVVAFAAFPAAIVGVDRLRGVIL